MNRILVALAAVLFSAASAPSAPSATAQDKPAAPPAAPQDPMKAKTDKHKKDVTRLRGLEFKKEVTVGVYSKEQLLEFLKGEFDKELPREKAARIQRGYAKFGLIPDDMDLYEAFLELFGSSIAGFYHPKTKELRLIKAGEGEGEEEKLAKAMGIDMDGITIVHELTHAAQDQNFELSTLPLEDETNDDLIMALKALIEGDASAVGWKYQFTDTFDQMIGVINSQYKSGMLPGKAGKLPAYLRLTLTFPYGYGTDFVVAYLKSSKGGLKDTSRAFEDFPLSTEQILHPSKYFDKEKRDNPTLVKLPDLAKLFGGPWKETFNNVHGEFCVQVLLRELKADRGDARRASEGWDGDRFVILEDDKNAAMYAWYSTWDSEDDAKELFGAYALALCRKYNQPTPEGGLADAQKIAFASKSGHVYIERREADVLVLDGGTEEMSGKVDSIWKGAVKTELKQVERLKKFVCAKCGVKEAFSGDCPKCKQPLKFQDKEEKKKVYQHGRKLVAGSP